MATTAEESNNNNKKEEYKVPKTVDWLFNEIVDTVVKVRKELNRGDKSLGELLVKTLPMADNKLLFVEIELDLLKHRIENGRSWIINIEY